jgi:hypothetical protein
MKKKLLQQINDWLFDTIENDWHGSCSDGGYYFTVTKRDDDMIEYQFNGASCYSADEHEKYTVNFGVATVYDDHVIIYVFNSYNGHGSTHCTDIESAKWYLLKFLSLYD